MRRTYRAFAQASVRSRVPAGMRVRLAITFIALVAAALPATAGAADVPPGAVWSQATIPSTDGVKLHADAGTQLSSYLAQQVTAPATPVSEFNLP
jgi:hypothetical protein